MSLDSRRIVSLGLLAAPLLWGCADEENVRQARFPQASPQEAEPESAPVGTSDGLPTEESAMQGVGEDQLPTASSTEGAPQGDYADTDPSALTDFRSTLDPHGQWLEDPTYGTVWQPNASEVGADFAPYVSGGHWAYDDSYYWVSDYNWGWAPFHYGRWVYASYGWSWIPGRMYAPAWVTWRTGYPGFGYVGWAPMPPTFYWGPGGYALGLGVVPAAPYVFCGTGNLFAPGGLQGRIVSAPAAVSTIAGQTHPYTPSASPSGGGRVAANPSVVGPTPQSLGLAHDQITPLSNNSQIARAAQFAHPSTAMAMGAHGPAVGGHLGALASQNLAHTNGLGNLGAHATGTYPGGAVAGHPQLSSRSMPSYGAPRSTYNSYNNFNANQSHLGGTYYGHGGSFRSYSAPAPHFGSTVHPTYQPYTGSTAPHYSTSGGSHFGGHYGGGGRGGGHR